MDRKESIKTMVLGTLSIPFLKGGSPRDAKAGSPQFAQSEPMYSRWADWPDMQWIGPGFWGNRLQDWRLAGGKAECNYSGGNRTLQCLTHQMNDRSLDFTCSVEAELVNQTGSENDYLGFRLGGKRTRYPAPVTFTDYRRAAVFSEGYDAGVTADGKLFIGSSMSSTTIALYSAIRLEVKGVAGKRSYTLKLSAFERSTDRLLGTFELDEVDPSDLTGNTALVSHFNEDNDGTETVSVRFSDWRLTGSKFTSNAEQVYGPILFAQYTLDSNIVKVTAQMAPVETLSGHKAEFQIRDGNEWKTLQETTLDPLSRTAHFRAENWNHTTDIPYRIRLELPLKDKTETFYYEGSIATEPASADQIKAAVFNCNQQHGFPDTEVVRNVTKHRPHLALFLGDQIYEPFGGFGVERSHDLKNSTLDYLHKWYMFGWSYRNIFRNIPSACILDDHDVFQGNIWGQGGKPADSAQLGFGGDGHDTGGYTMLAEWVKMVERTQTEHLPDPYDPTPVKQGIGVYYTDWTYGGISFALLEDRKFKTAPKNVFPEEADIYNGFVRNPDFDVTQYYDIEADLLGERQHKFLEEWVTDWSKGAQMKVVASQTPFCCAHTMPKGADSDRIVSQRTIPERGVYPEGDYPAQDMDSNGWPAKQRNKALDIIRRASALHLAGDQHLPIVIRYGIQDFQDAGYVFTGPALNNTWPRRWWPTLEKDHRPIPGRPLYTGNFKDAFENKITVLAVANPGKVNREPGIIYDRSTGYGMVNFDKNSRMIRIECWPRNVDPTTNPGGQYEDWPITIRQTDNDGRRTTGYLQEFNINGLENPVIQVYNQNSGQLEYALRIRGKSFRPHIFQDGRYRVRIGEPDRNQWQEYENLSPDNAQGSLTCNFT